MLESGTTSYKDTKGLASLAITTSNVPDVQDWGLLHKWILKNKATDLLQRRVSVTAWRDRLENGEKIPNIAAYNKKTLRIKV